MTQTTKNKIEETGMQIYFEYLDELRESGATNMFGAAPYLQAEFGLEKKEAREVLSAWMQKPK